MSKPNKALRRIGYFTRASNDKRRYHSWRYYCWHFKSGWRMCPHSTWLVILNILIDVYGMTYADACDDEEIELDEDVVKE